MIVNTNVASLNAWMNLQAQTSSLQSSMEKLSSGKRVNTAADDAAGYAIAQKMSNQINGLGQAATNAQNANSLIQTAVGGLTETESVLQSMRQLAVEAGTATNTASDRGQIQQEMSQLVQELQRVATQTQFNTKNILNGSATGMVFQIGANKGQIISLQISAVTVTALFGTTAGGSGAVSVTQASTTGMSAQISVIDTAISMVSRLSAKLGALQNRLSDTVTNLNTASTNLSSALSNVQDVDMAKEMAQLTKTQVLVSAGTAMLAQANQAPQAVLKLLG
jgi:flagellin